MVTKRTHPSWGEFIRMARPQTNWSEVGLVLCLDPGETTGWAVFGNGELLDCGQEPTPEPSDMFDFINATCYRFNHDIDLGDIWIIVYEEYRIRGNKAQQHVGSEVITIQLIGAIKVAADSQSLDLVKQGAGMAKGFADDGKLKQWGLYQTGKRHANDAIRHGVYWHLFAAGRNRGG